MLLLSLLACQGSLVETAWIDTASDSNLHGVPPGSAVLAPEFLALHHDGSLRGPDHLRTGRHILWFYPNASGAL